MPIAEATYLALTTYRRTGEPVATPVWAVGLPEGRVGVWTNATSGKVSRLHRDPHVTVSLCDRRGRVAEGATSYDGTAEVLRSGGVFEEVLGRVRVKYGWLGWAALTLRRSRANDAVLVLTLAQVKSD